MGRGHESPFAAIHCGAKVGHGSKITSGELCTQYVILASIAGLLAVAGGVGMIRVVWHAPRYKGTRVAILGFCTLEAVLSFVAWFAYPLRNVVYGIHILQNLTIITVTLNLTLYASTISRSASPRVLYPLFGLLYGLEAALAVLVYAENDTKEAGDHCESYVWMVMIGVGAVMTSVFTLCGIYIAFKLSSLVARNTFARLYYRSKRRKLITLIIIYSTCSLLSLAFYIAQRSIAEHDNSKTPCYTFHASKGWPLVAERILIISVTFFIPSAAVIYQFSSVPQGDEQSALLAPPSGFSPLTSSSWPRGSSSPYASGPLAYSSLNASYNSYNSATRASTAGGAYRIQTPRSLQTPPFAAQHKASAATATDGRSVRTFSRPDPVVVNLT